MSTRIPAWKRTLILMSMGGMPFAWGFWGCNNGVTRNADIVSFYQESGAASIAAVSDGVFNDQVADSDYDTIVREPATNFLTALWANWVSLQFPLDPSSGNVFRD